MTHAHGESVRADLLAAYAAALEAVGGRQRVAEVLASEVLAGEWQQGSVGVVAIGKAAAHMLAGACDALGERIGRALLITKHGHVERLWPDDLSVVCMESAHPQPDATSLEAGRALIDFLGADGDDERFLVFLVSGGASSLVESLGGGLGEEVLGEVGGWLLASGLPITAINRVRKRLSRIKAGRLAAHLRGRKALHLMISDVPGDDPRVIGSGLLVPHAPADIAVDDLPLPGWLRALAREAPPLAPAEAFAGVRTLVIARPEDARRAASEALLARGYVVRLHEQLVEGEAVPVGRELVRQVLAGGSAAHVWAGETTVTLPENPGRGGRCQNLALAAAEAISGRGDVWLLAAGTDGSDGPVEDAGALVDGGTITRGRDAGLDPGEALVRADAGTFLEASGDLIHTGPTGTNVMDLMIGVRGAPAR